MPTWRFLCSVENILYWRFASRHFVGNISILSAFFSTFRELTYCTAPFCATCYCSLKLIHIFENFHKYEESKYIYKFTNVYKWNLKIKKCVRYDIILWKQSFTCFKSIFEIIPLLANAEDIRARHYMFRLECKLNEKVFVGKVIIFLSTVLHHYCMNFNFKKIYFTRLYVDYGTKQLCKTYNTKKKLTDK